MSQQPISRWGLIRTKEQLDFDRAAHGWAFCSAAMLSARLPSLRELAAKLTPDDGRHDLLLHIEGAARRISE